MRAAFALIGLLVCFILVVKRLKKSKYRLPPGPSALPVLGSVHHLTLEFQERMFLEWKKKYGDIIYFKLFRTPTIVLNTLEAARDLLDKRSAKYSDRPRMVLLAELNGHESSLPPMRYGDRFRKHRRWMHEYLSTKTALQSCRPIQLREVHILLRDLVKSPQTFTDHLYKYVVAVLLEITYGRRLVSMNDELIKLAERSVNASNDGGSPGSMLVDFFPILKHLPTWMPGAGFKRRALRGKEALQRWKEVGMNMVKTDMACGTGSPCITSSLLEAYKENLDEVQLEDISGVGVSIYGAGTETTFGSLATFILAMVRNSSVLKKAQEEMDTVVGPDRLPDFDDRESLPYLGAVLEEVYRWNPGLPLGLPHRVISNDEYRGYDVPEGFMIMPNIWGMTRDTTRYPDPEDFLPERHLTPGGKLAKDNELPSSFIFGFGRRVCPGQAFADRALWLAVANIIATLDIRKVIDASGKEITPPAAFLPGFTSRPRKFVCTIVPRSGKVANTIAQLDVSVEDVEG